MATSNAPLLVCLSLGLLAALVTSGLFGMHVLPPWLEAPLLRLRAYEHSMMRTQFLKKDDTESAGPEGVLVQQLKSVDVKQEPAKAYILHSAIGKILRSSGVQGKRVLDHLEAARDAAKRGGDPDALLSAHLDLADAYIEEGKPLDSQRELAVASGVMPNHFAEHSVKLNRVRGHAKFELGHTTSALQYFEEAARTASKPEDVVRIVCDSAMAQTCLGHAHKALEPLQWGLEVLQAAEQEGSDEGLPAWEHDVLAAEVHFRLAEAFHYLASEKHADTDKVISSAESAEAHYTKALHFQKKSSTSKPLLVSAIKKGLARLRQSLTQDLEGVLKPLLHCPSQKTAPWDKVQPTNVKAPDFIAKIGELWAEHKYDLAVSELKVSLKAHSRPYKSFQAAVALNMLGETYQRQGSFSNAAKYFRQALHAILMNGDVDGDVIEEADKAYNGLNDIKDKLSSTEKQVAIAALDQYHERAFKLGIEIDTPDTPDSKEEDPDAPGVMHAIVLL